MTLNDVLDMISELTNVHGFNISNCSVNGYG
jgi:hypothetical protein